MKLTYPCLTWFAALSAVFSLHAADETVTLPEFAVRADATRGYIASESVTGTRVATSIKDLPFTVNVVTSEFLDDFGIFDLGDNSLAYTSGVTGIDNAGDNNMRGYSSQYMLRDGFFRLGMSDKVNIDRIEIIKGPNAAIYGETQPGGIMNVISKRPKKTASGDVSATFGSYQTDRVEVSATGPMKLLPKTYVIASASDYERVFDTPISSLRNRSASFGVEHDYANGDVYVNLEYMRNQSHSPILNVPYLYDSTAKRYVGVAYDLEHVNENGPKSETTRDVYSATVTDEHRINDVFSYRAAANWYHRHKWLFNAGSGTQYDFLKGTLNKGTPAKGLIGEDGGGVQADLLANYPTFAGKVQNKTLLTFDLSDYYRFDPTWQLASQYQISSASKIPASGPYWLKPITIGQPIDYTVPDFSPAVYSSLTRYNKNRATIWGGLLRHQMALWNSRLLLFASLRYDDVKLRLHSYLGTGLIADGNSTAWSPSVGFNYKATSHLAVYGSRSNGFNANAQNQLATTGIQPNERDWGYDYGVKAGLLDDRLQFTAGGYYVFRRNVSVTELQPDGTTTSRADGSQLSRGVECDFTYQVTPNLTFLGGYGHVNSKMVADGRDIGAIGYSPRSVPVDNFGLATKYVLSGALNGLSLTSGVTYVGKTHPENPETGDLFDATGHYIGNDGRRDITLPGYYVVNLGASYRFRLSARAKTANLIMLNLKNALNHSYISINRANDFPGDARGIYLTDKLSW